MMMVMGVCVCARSSHLPGSVIASRPDEEMQTVMAGFTAIAQ